MHTWTQTHAHTHTWPHTQVRHVIFQLWQHVRSPVQSPGGQGGGGEGGGGGGGKEKISNPVATGPRGSVGARAGRGGGGEKGGAGEGGGEEGEDHAVAIDLLLGMGFSRAQVPCVCVCVRARTRACARIVAVKPVTNSLDDLCVTHRETRGWVVTLYAGARRVTPLFFQHVGCC